MITGIDRMEILEQALDAVRTFHPLDAAEVRALLARTSTVAASGRFELFKTSDRFDATARHPGWLG